MTNENRIQNEIREILISNNIEARVFAGNKNELGKITYMLDKSNKSDLIILNPVKAFNNHNLVCIDVDVDNVVDSNTRLGHIIQLLEQEGVCVAYSKKNRARIYLKDIHTLLDLKKEYIYNENGFQGKLEILYLSNHWADYALNNDENNEYYTRHNVENLLEDFTTTEAVELLVLFLNSLVDVVGNIDSKLSKKQRDTYRDDKQAKQAIFAYKYDKLYEYMTKKHGDKAVFQQGNRNNALFFYYLPIFENNKYLSFLDFESFCEYITENIDTGFDYNNYFRGSRRDKFVNKEVYGLDYEINDDKIDISNEELYRLEDNSTTIYYGIDLKTDNLCLVVKGADNSYAFKKTTSPLLKDNLLLVGINDGDSKELLSKKRARTCIEIELDEPSINKPILFKDLYEMDKKIATKVLDSYGEYNIRNETMIFNTFIHKQYTPRLLREDYEENLIEEIEFNDLPEYLRNSLENSYKNDVYENSLEMNLTLQAAHFIYNRRAKGSPIFVDNGGTGKDTLIDLYRNLYKRKLLVNASKESFSSMDILRAAVVYMPELKIERNEWSEMKKNLDNNFITTKIKNRDPGQIQNDYQMMIGTSNNLRGITHVCDSEEDIKPFCRRFNLIYSESRLNIDSAPLDYEFLDKNDRNQMEEAAEYLARYFYSIGMKYSKKELYEICNEYEKRIRLATQQYILSNREKSLKEQVIEFIDDYKSGGDLLWNQLIENNINRDDPQEFNFRDINNTLCDLFNIERLPKECITLLKSRLWKSFDKNISRNKIFKPTMKMIKCEEL